MEQGFTTGLATPWKVRVARATGARRHGRSVEGLRPQLERYVAIKLLHADLQADPEFNTRFTREAKVIASLHYPNIVGIYDFQISHPPKSHTPTAYMVMEYIEGQTLAHYIRSTSREGKFPPPMHIVHLFLSISKAVDYAHQQGMIHRDIKPSQHLVGSTQYRVQSHGRAGAHRFRHCKAPGC